MGKGRKRREVRERKRREDRLERGGILEEDKRGIEEDCKGRKRRRSEE